MTFYRFSLLIDPVGNYRDNIVDIFRSVTFNDFNNLRLVTLPRLRHKDFHDLARHVFLDFGLGVASFFKTLVQDLVILKIKVSR